MSILALHSFFLLLGNEQVRTHYSFEPLTGVGRPEARQRPSF